LRKLIRYSATAILAWAGVTFAWAAFSHLTGFVGPAQASAASLQFVANAVEFMDPPGVLGAPQRFAADQIRRTARSAERLHRGPERAMARLVDNLGHSAAHKKRRRHRDHWHYSGSPDVQVEIPIDAIDRATERARELAVIELERHRSQARREADRARRDADRIRRDADRVRREVERVRQRFRFRTDRSSRAIVEIEALKDRLRSANLDLDGDIAVGRLDLGGLDNIEITMSPEARVELESRIERLETVLSRLEADERADGKGDFRRKLGETLRDVLEELRRELEDFDVDANVDVSASPGADGSIELRIRGN
jgi:hypothetical protein